MDIKTLDAIRSESLKVIEKAANFIHDHLDKVNHGDISEKGRNSLVSYVDRKSEEILVEGLSRLLPDAGFITEEETIAQSSNKLTWVIDPLDGTTNFLHKLPCYSVSVALMADDKIVIGMVHNVADNEVFSAVRNSGALLNGNIIKVTDRQDFHDILVGTGFPYTTEHFTEDHLKVLKNILISTRGIRRLGSAAIDLCYVACGRFGAFYENSLNSYDIAAGALIVKEAGGWVSDFGGENSFLEKGEILACAPQFRNIMMENTSVFIHSE